VIASFVGVFCLSNLVNSGEVLTLVGVLYDVFAILIFGILGKLFFYKLFSPHSEAINRVLGLVIAFIGIRGGLKSEDIGVLIASLVVGCLIGEMCDIEGKINRAGDRLESFRFFNGNKIAKGFISGSLLFCVGSMAIIGPLESGLTGNNDLLVVKSILDAVIAIILTASLGIGVILSVVPVLVYMGAIAVGSSALSAVLSDSVVTEISAAGSILLIGIGINFMGTKFQIKVTNLIPALVMPWIIIEIRDHISTLFN